MTEPDPEQPRVEAPSVEAPPKTTWQRYRWLAVIVLFVGLYAIGKGTGLIDQLDARTIRETVAEAGPWGVLVFCAIFAVGELIHIPGMVFVAAGVLAYGQVGGFLVSLLGAVVSVSVSFFVVRGLGGKALSGVNRPFMQKMLSRLHARPILTIFILRAIFWVAPPLNYALALTSVRYRDYLIGSVLGLVVPVFLAAIAFDLIFGA